MKTSQIFFATNYKDDSLLQRAGMLRRLADSRLVWLPMGVRVLQNIKQALCDRLYRLGAVELCLTSAMERSLEQVVDAIRSDLRSYKRLPLQLFEISEDHQYLTLFAISQEALVTLQQQAKQMYTDLLQRLGLGGDSTKWVRGFDATGITLSGFRVLDQQGKATPVWVSHFSVCFSEIISAVVEKNRDKHGVIWPEIIAPFNVVLLPIRMHKSYRVREQAEALYQQLQHRGISVLMDDRKERPVKMFTDMDLVGIPHRVVVSERGIDDGVVEYKSRNSDTSEHVIVSELLVKLGLSLQETPLTERLWACNTML